MPQNNNQDVDNQTADSNDHWTVMNSTSENTSTRGEVESEPVDFTFTTILIPIATVVLVLILVIVLTVFWIRMKRNGRDGRQQKGGRSSSIDDQKANKNEVDLKTISNISTSSVDEDDQSISLQHWTSKKAVSNRYESWHIGEINNEWVSSSFHLKFHERFYFILFL